MGRRQAEVTTTGCMMHIQIQLLVEIPATCTTSALALVTSSTTIAAATTTPYVSEANQPAGSFLMPRLYGFHSAGYLSFLLGTPRCPTFHRTALSAENKRKSGYSHLKKISRRKIRKGKLINIKQNKYIFSVDSS